MCNELLRGIGVLCISLAFACLSHGELEMERTLVTLLARSPALVFKF